MLAPTRPLPTVGARARIVHFGGGAEEATVVVVAEDGRRLQVRDEADQLHEFVLNRGTATFVQAGAGAHGARLQLLAP
ncbi:MAG TPA: hypothetical protein VED41_10860 [Solirubrobacteraceae bacterium]|nr:hypothetical protein [Solirubrobacteraceae bacterium]